MGCNKSKSHNGGSEGYQDYNDQWDIGEETYSLNDESSELPNRISKSNDSSNIVFKYNVSNDKSRQNSEKYIGYNHSDNNCTVYEVDCKLNNTQYYNPNESIANVCTEMVDKPSSSSNPAYTNYNVELTQYQYSDVFNQQYSSLVNQEHWCEPPKLSTLKKRVQQQGLKCDSCDGDSLTHSSSSSLRQRGLKRNSCDYDSLNSNSTSSSHQQEFRLNSCDNDSLSSNSTSSSRQRGLKCNSCEQNSLNSNSTLSDNLGSLKEYGAEPLVKRRLSDVPDKKSENLTIKDRKRMLESKGPTNESKIIDKREQQPCIDDDSFDVLDLLKFPNEWSSCAGNMDRTGLVYVSPTSPEGMSVRKYFNRTSQSKDFSLIITDLARIENPFMHTYFLFKKQEMESRNEHVDELYLYHGTKKEHLSGILKDNLNWRLYSEKHRFGQGVSFSPFATYSSHYSDKSPEKVMFLFKVLCSNSTSGCPDMKVPPIIGNTIYDTSIKDDATVIVKYSDNEFYPLYKITYSKIMRNK